MPRSPLAKSVFGTHLLNLDLSNTVWPHNFVKLLTQAADGIYETSNYLEIGFEIYWIWTCPIYALNSSFEAATEMSMVIMGRRPSSVVVVRVRPSSSSVRSLNPCYLTIPQYLYAFIGAMRALQRRWGVRLEYVKMSKRWNVFKLNNMLRYIKMENIDQQYVGSNGSFDIISQSFVHSIVRIVLFCCFNAAFIIIWSFDIISQSFVHSVV